jgi:hypothetical protein
MFVAPTDIRWKKKNVFRRFRRRNNTANRQKTKTRQKYSGPRPVELSGDLERTFPISSETFATRTRPNGFVR